MSSECPKTSDTSPNALLTSKWRYVLLAALSGTTSLPMLNCSDDDGTTTPPPKGWGCVTILDQQDKPMTVEGSNGAGTDGGVGGAGGAGGSTGVQSADCTTNYELPPEANSYGCAAGQLLVYGSPGTQKVPLECGKTTDQKLVGHAIVDIDEGENKLYKTRVVGSMCTDGAQLVADPEHLYVKLNDHLGFSSPTVCGDWMDRVQLINTEVAKIELDCSQGAGGSAPDGGTESGAPCDPIDGRDYLIPQGTPGQSSNGEPKHLTFKAAPELVPPGTEVTINVTLRQMNGAQQEIKVPIIIRGSEIVGGDGGAGGTSGSDAGGADAGGGTGGSDAGKMDAKSEAK
jgi:hypothetical protein